MPAALSAPIRYRIAPLDRHAHLFEVSITVAAPDPEGQRLRLPSWVPGSYLIREFARHFVRVTAACGDVAVPIEKVAKDIWRAAPCAGDLVVTAHVYAYDLSVRTAYLDATRGFFSGASVFLCPEGRESAPCTLDIVAPVEPGEARWEVATTLPREGASPYGFGRYRATDYDELIDHPVEMAAFARTGFTAGGVPHDIVISGRHNADLPRLTQDLSRVCQWHCDLFGGAPESSAPFPRYLFQVMAVGEGYGGLEHRSSTSLICRRDHLPAPATDVDRNDDYIGFLGLASHEYFHAWNVKRIKPAAFTPYDLARENYTRQLWAFEGITSYYDDLALVRTGLVGAAKYLELLGRTMTTVLRGPGRHVQTLAESSFDAWIKYYRPDENTPNAVVSYYLKGSLVALALDLTLRASGHSSLDDVMRALWQRYGRSGIGVPEDGITAVTSEIAGRDMADFFRRYVNGTDDLPFADLFAPFGIEVGLRAAAGPKDRGGKDEAHPLCSSFGARVAPDMQLQAVVPGGAASRAGLSAGDVLVAIDGIKASPELLSGLLRRADPGTAVAVHAFRRDELLRCQATLAAAPLDTAFLKRVGAPTAEAQARFREWLGVAQ